MGDGISIRLFGIDTPEMRGTTDEVKALAMQAQQVTEKALKRASNIELRNPQRGKYFRIISEVWVDGEMLGRNDRDNCILIFYNRLNKINMKIIFSRYHVSSKQVNSSTNNPSCNNVAKRSRIKTRL